MYKPIISIAFILVISLQVFAQEYQYVPFPDSGAVWNEIFYNYNEDAEDKTRRENFAVNGEDTIINDIVYSKLYMFLDTIFNKNTATCIGGIREDSLRRIYYNGEQIHFLKPNVECAYENNEIKLFDFGLQIGDTIWSLNSLDATHGLIVSSVDTLLLGNSLRRKINFLQFSNNNPVWDFSWIEGIGSTRGLLYISDTTPYNRLNHLICFKHNGNLLFLHPVYNDCFPTSNGLTKQTLENKVKIYPNPVIDNEVRISFNGLNIETISIYNEYGCFITSVDVKGLENTIISVPNIVPGAYFYVAYSKYGKIGSGKFMVQ